MVNDLHSGAKSSVKWKYELSEPFSIEQGVRQGGILSADLYKVYVNTLLENLRASHQGARIGNISVCAPCCADDIALMSNDPDVLQILLNAAAEYSNKHRYVLQPRKSVVLQVLCSNRQKKHNTHSWTINNKELPIVNKAVHLGITRADSHENTVKETVNDNIKKSRRTLYSLMTAGMHGENGLDPECNIHLLKTYVIPVLLYGLEILLPENAHLQSLESFLRKVIKQILSLSTSTPDPIAYVLSGIIPVEGQIHIKALTFYNGICLHENNSIEKQLLMRQISVKNRDSSSWFTKIENILTKYKLPDCFTVLQSGMNKYCWRRQVYSAVNSYWQSRVIEQAELYSQLVNINFKIFEPCALHPVVTTEDASVREAKRLSVKIKMSVGTYIMQTTRAKFNQAEVKGTCLLCNTADETLEHLLLDCSILDSVRNEVFRDINEVLNKTCSRHTTDFTTPALMQILLDSTFLPQLTPDVNRELLPVLEHHTRRLCYNLHGERQKYLTKTENRRRRCPGTQLSRKKILSL